MTAIQFYFAAQSRPTTLQQLGAETPSLLTRPLTAEENERISEGHPRVRAYRLRLVSQGLARGR